MKKDERFLLTRLLAGDPGGDAHARIVRRLRAVWTAAVMLALYVIGLGLWAYLMNFGRFEPRYMDWGKEFGSYRIMAEAVTHGTIPWHASIAPQDSNRILAVPEIAWFPTLLLLRTHAFPFFVLVHYLVTYTIGFAGVCALGRYLRLGLLPLAFLAVLFCFNGYIVAHLTIGHTMWTGYFLFPWLLIPLLRMLEGRGGAGACIALAAGLFLMFLLGSFHLWVQWLMFVAVVCASRRRLWRIGIAVIVLAGLVAAVRLLPAAVTFAGDRPHVAAGFPTLTKLAEGLVVPRDAHVPLKREVLAEIPVYWWEYNYFIGPAALGAIVVFGLWRRLRREARATREYPELDIAALVFALLSLSIVYTPVMVGWFPLLGSQRFPTRFFIFPLFVYMVLTVLRLQRERGVFLANPAHVLIATVLGVHILHELLTQAVPWNVMNSAAGRPESRLYTQFSQGMIVTMEDPAYILSVKAGAAITAVALAGMLAVMIIPGLRTHADRWLMRDERQAAPAESPTS